MEKERNLICVLIICLGAVISVQTENRVGTITTRLQNPGNKAGESFEDFMAAVLKRKNEPRPENGFRKMD